MTDTRERSLWTLPDTAPDPAELADAWTRVVENATALMQANMRGAGAGSPPVAYDPTAPARAFAEFTAQLWTNPLGVLEASRAASSEWMELWRRTALGISGARQVPLVEPARGDRRFGDAAWSEEPVFDYLKQAYLLASRQATALIDDAEGIDDATRTRARFFTQSYLDALSPANFAFTNPEAIRRAIETGSISLLSGLANLLADAATEARLPVRRAGQSFVLGETIAATKGSVIFRNEMMELIQYEALTKKVHRRPLLYIPPLVNKFYVLDLQPHTSLLRWMVEQGHTVFVISWINPGPDLADKGIADYVALGPLAALDVIEKVTGERETDIFGFCMGGTLLAITLGVAAARGQADRIASATLIGTLLDFSKLGQWATFGEDQQLAALERHLEKRGYISAHDLQALFSVVRANDLIWSSVVSHYLLDREAPPSDLLHWFADGANIPKAFLLDWAREIQRANALTRPGGVVVGGASVDLAKVETPVMAISLKDDHVSGWQATYDGARLFGGPTRFVLGGSGHNAGVVNPPAANKHGYWTNEALPESAEDWMEGAERHEGSWWPDWQRWLVREGEDRVPARKVGGGKLKPIEPAPGSYVRMQGGGESHVV
ncbi:MAG: alpha/beta fold hydrolase [Sphingomonadaceae bacterium]|nr:alpha/beta fold hydrolase [Sphingomonadaceae bacterium]